MESLDARVDFNERRARALEGAVIYRPQSKTSGRRTPCRPRPQIAPPERSPSRAPVLVQVQPLRSALRLSGHERVRRRLRSRAGAGAAREFRSAQQTSPAPAWPSRRRCRRRPHGLPCRTRSRDRRRRPRRASQTDRQPASEPTGLGLMRRIVDGSADEVARTRRFGRLRTRRVRRRAVKLAVVVQRYGQAINGGAELHARYIAEHLARHAEVDVLTTYASDYVTWRNEPRPAHERHQRRSGAPLSRGARARSFDFQPAIGGAYSRAGIRSPTSSAGSTPKDRRAPRS